jgi:cytochrome c6
MSMTFRQLGSMQRLSVIGRMAVAGALLLVFANGAAVAADIVKGRQLYNMHCANCHGANGISFMPGAPNFARQERMMQPDVNLAVAIRNGKNAMPAFAGVLTESQIFDVVGYMRTFR